ncbi:hypothetical protein PSPTOT1_3720 [Pseudomonas syringae pv. tomato T1]|nr:hypothetical protein PSPTOT1_3720 [Pseudomonas syringae pv. tomato T1]
MPTSWVNELPTAVRLFPMVTFVLLNSSSTETLCAWSAFTTASAVSRPAAPSVRSSPTVFPMPAAIAWANAGACSITLFNSSPRSTPDAKACPNWTSAALADAAEAPEIAKVLLIVPTTPATPSPVSFNSFWFVAIRWYSSAVAFNGWNEL